MSQDDTPPTLRDDQIAVHTNPCWRDRANFIIMADIPDIDNIPDQIGLVRREQLFARRVADREFEICCIPYFLYDVALGDVVATDRHYLLRTVLRPSGRYVFRVWFGRSDAPIWQGDVFADRDRMAAIVEQRTEVLADIDRMPVLVEHRTHELIAIDASDHEQAQKVADYLASQQEKGRLIYDTGRS